MVLWGHLPKVHINSCCSGQLIQGGERKDIYPLASAAHWPMIHPGCKNSLSQSCRDRLWANPMESLSPQGQEDLQSREWKVPGVDIRRGTCRIQLEPVERSLVSPLPSLQKTELEGTKIQMQVGTRHRVSPQQDPAHNETPPTMRPFLKLSGVLLCTASDLWRVRVFAAKKKKKKTHAHMILQGRGPVILHRNEPFNKCKYLPCSPGGPS